VNRLLINYDWIHSDRRDVGSSNGLEYVSEISAILSAIAAIVTAIATIVLVNVTKKYVELTGKLAGASQEQINRLDAQSRMPMIRNALEYLIDFRLYCNAMLGEIAPSDLRPNLESLNPKIARGGLSLREDFENRIRIDMVFLPVSSVKALEDLLDSIGMLASAELMFASQEDQVFEDGLTLSYSENMGSLYESLIEKADTCIEQLRLDARLPKWHGSKLA
jgi:hypothetical protein